MSAETEAEAEVQQLRFQPKMVSFGFVKKGTKAILVEYDRLKLMLIFFSGDVATMILKLKKNSDGINLKFFAVHIAFHEWCQISSTRLKSCSLHVRMNRFDLFTRWDSNPGPRDKTRGEIGC